MRPRFLVVSVLYAVITLVIAGGNAHVSAQAPPIQIHVEEGIGVGDGVGADPPAIVEADEDVVVAEDPTITPPAIVLVAENVGVSEDPVADLVSLDPVDIEVADGISITDDSAVAPPLTIVFNDSVSINDSGGPVSSTPIVEAGPDITVVEGQAADLQASVVTLNPELTTAVIEWGDGNTDTVAPTATGAISVLHLYEGDGVYMASVTVTGPFGDSGSDTVQITVQNVSPFVDIGGPYGGAALSAIVLTADGTDPGGDPLVYTWDFDDDRQFDDATGQTVIFSSSTPGVFPVAVRATDGEGLGAGDSTDVTVTGATLSTELGPAFTPNTGPGFGSLVPPSILSPIDGSILTSSTLEIEWSPGGFSVDTWFLSVGTTEYGIEIVNHAEYPASTTSATVTVPAGTVYVSLGFVTTDSNTGAVFATYPGLSASPGPGSTAPVPTTELSPALSQPPFFTAPVSGSVDGLTFTVAWDPNGNSVDQWRLEVQDLSGLLQTTTLAGGTTTTDVTVPSPGAKSLRLFFLIDGDWRAIQTQILVLADSTRSFAQPAITTPVEGATVNGPSVPIEWTPDGLAVTYWTLKLGSYPGGADLYNSGIMSGSTTSRTVSLTSGTVYARLLYFRTSWQHVDSWFTVAGGSSNPQLSWGSGDWNASGAKDTVSWTHQTSGVTQYQLWVGSTPGSGDIHDSGPLLPADKAATITGLPADDGPLFVRLWWELDDVWHFVDQAGVSENQYQVDFGPPVVDTDQPVTTIEFAGQHVYSNGVHEINKDTQIYFLATDVNPVSIEYRVDGGIFQPAYPFKLTQAGLYTVDYRATDSVGNVEDTKSALVSVSGGGALATLASPQAAKVGPAIALHTKNLSGDRPARAGDQILVKAVPSGKSSSSSGGRFDDSMSTLSSFEVNITSGSGTDTVDVDWETPHTGNWIFTVPTDSAGEVIDIQVVATGKDGKAGDPASVRLEVLSEFTVTLDVTPASIENFSSVLMTATPHNLGEFTGVRRYLFYEVRPSNSPRLLGSTYSNTLERTLGSSDAKTVTVFVVAVDDFGATAQSNLVDVKIIGGTGSTDTSVGKTSGRGLVGTLIRLSALEVVVDTDFGSVRVHIDPGATRLNASLDAEAFTTGSRVVVVADRDLGDPDAVAVTITQIPEPDAKAKRSHKRVVVADPDPGNTHKLVGADGKVIETGKPSDVGTTSGDQVVLVVKKDRTGSDSDVKIVAHTDDVDERLDRIAQEKFDEGKADDSASIDDLREKQRKHDETLAEKVLDHEDENIKDAARDSAAKIEAEKEKEASDPVKAIRKKAASDADDAILECASNLLGRPVSGEGDLTEAEEDRVVQACLDEDEEDGDRVIPEDAGEREEPPAEVLECIIRVLGGVPDGPIDDAEKARLNQVCFPDDVDGDDEGVEDRDDVTGVSDARKIAFCEANPSDPHCGDFRTPDPSGSTGTTDGDGDDPSDDDSDATEAEKEAHCEANPSDPRCAEEDDSDEVDDSSASDADKRAFCDANPGDLRCSSDGTSDGDSDSSDKDAELAKFCAANPTDPHCTGGGDSSGTKDDGGGSGTKDDGGDTRGTKGGK